jgi:multidrug resistance efflux pump
VVGALGFIPVQKLVPPSDVDAMINARVIALSAPIDGEVQIGLPENGTPFANGDLLSRLFNERADRLRVDDLAREIQRLNDERPGIAARLADAAQAKNEEAKTTLDRFATLASKGWTSRAQLNQVQRDGSIVEKSRAAAECPGADLVDEAGIGSGSCL